MRRRRPSKVAEPGEVAAAISAAGVTTVKEEAVQQGEQDIDKVYKFRDAILEGATAFEYRDEGRIRGIVHEACDRVDVR